jgi:hypothetical protein
MPAEELGVPALVTRGRKPLGKGEGTEPKRIQHATLGVEWIVVEVIESWQHPGGQRAVEGQPVLKSWDVVRVFGPLPARPGESGRFLMEIASYGYPRGWWITPLALPSCLPFAPWRPAR